MRRPCPLAGPRYNPNFDLGHDGIVGVAAGSDTATNGCYLFATRKFVNGQSVTLYGAVLGQSGPTGPDTAAVDAGDGLVRAALGAITAVPVFPARHVVGELSAQWGASAPVIMTEPVTVVGWPGLSVVVTARLNEITVPVAAGSRIGVLQIHQGSTSPAGYWRARRSSRGPPHPGAFFADGTPGSTARWSRTDSRARTWPSSPASTDRFGIGLLIGEVQGGDVPATGGSVTVPGAIRPAPSGGMGIGKRAPAVSLSQEPKGLP